MGLLDPKLDKERTFELLRKKGAVKAVLIFDGGHDDGTVESITLTLTDGSEADLPTWYCGGYRFTKEGYEPLSTPANEDEELADLLEGPVNQEFGSWGDVPSTHGTLTWDVAAGTAKLEYEQERYMSIAHSVDF